MKTTQNAKNQGWVDGIHWLLIVRHFDGRDDELIGTFDSEQEAEAASADLDEVAKAMSLILNPHGEF